MTGRKAKYRAYLKSRDWSHKRAKKFRRSQWCAICGSDEQLQVHHLFYRPKLNKTQQSDLRILCDRCHKIGHELIAAHKIKINLSQIRNHGECFNILRKGVLKHLGVDLSHDARRAFEENKLAEYSHLNLDRDFERAIAADK
jgi:hypothetical protein